jgi:Uma2 family endonuclease
VAQAGDVAIPEDARYIAWMNIALRTLLTVDDYLAWARTQSDPPRTELINGQIVPMSPERIAHNRAKGKVYLALTRAIATAGIKCEAFTDGLTVPIDQHTAYEPDALVRCGAPLPPDQMKVTDPIIIVEVKSPSTAHMDTSAKLIGYFKLPSVCHYLFVDPDAREITHHKRSASGSVEAATLMSGIIRLNPPGLTIEATDLFG